MQTVVERRAYWETHIKAWKDSGETQRQYCARLGIKLSTLRYYAEGSATPKEKPTKLVPVKVSGVLGGGLVLQGAGGWQLSLPPEVPARWLAELLRTL